MVLPWWSSLLSEGEQVNELLPKIASEQYFRKMSFNCYENKGLEHLIKCLRMGGAQFEINAIIWLRKRKGGRAPWVIHDWERWLSSVSSVLFFCQSFNLFCEAPDLFLEDTTDLTYKERVLTLLNKVLTLQTG